MQSFWMVGLFLWILLNQGSINHLNKSSSLQTLVAIQQTRPSAGAAKSKWIVSNPIAVEVSEIGGFGGSSVPVEYNLLKNYSKYYCILLETVFKFLLHTAISYDLVYYPIVLWQKTEISYLLTSMWQCEPEESESCVFSFINNKLCKSILAILLASSSFFFFFSLYLYIKLYKWRKNQSHISGVVAW